MRSNSILFLVLTALFAALAAIGTLSGNDLPRGFINTPIGFAIIFCLMTIREEIIVLRTEISKSNIITESLLKMREK